MPLTYFMRLFRDFAVMAVIVAPLPALAAAAHKGDPVVGKLMYTECAGCHAFRDNKIGPRHCGLIGRKAAGVPDFKSYSEAMRKSGLVWNEKTLNEFLASPLSYVPETLMGYAGIDDEKSRIDLIAYIKQMSDDPKICPQAP